jgi:hypothetical protein
MRLQRRYDFRIALRFPLKRIHVIRIHMKLFWSELTTAIVSLAFDALQCCDHYHYDNILKLFVIERVSQLADTLDPG